MFKQWMIALVATAALAATAHAQVETDLKDGDRVVSALTMGEGEHVVIALHGAGGNDRRYFFSDNGGNVGQALAKAGFRVIAITWPGQAGAGFPETDVAVAHAKATGAKKISIIGHSRGGELAANYVRRQPDGSFDTVVQFSSVDDQGLNLAKTKKLFAFNKYDRFAKWQSGAFDKSVDPKQMVALGGSAHPVGDLLKDKADLIDEVVALLKK